MAFTMLKYSLTIIIINYQLISIKAEAHNNKSLRILSRQVRDPTVSFTLRQFIHAVTYYWNDCSWPCLVPKDLDSAIDFGCHNTSPDDSKRTCPPEFWILNWEMDDLGQSENRTVCPTAPASLGTFKCFVCICINRYFDGTDEADSIKTFSLFKQESEFENNKVVTGLRYSLNDKIVHLQIQQAKLLDNGKVDDEKTWKDIVDVTKSSDSKLDVVSSAKVKSGDNYLEFEPFTRTFYLDDIYVPNTYVVTGAKFSEIGQTAERNGIKLEIKGTKFDEHYRLLKGTDKWFDFTNSASKHVSYGPERVEIDLKNCDASYKAPRNEPIKFPNYYVRFRAAKDYADDAPRPAIPYFNGDAAETRDNLPLRGLGLSYEGYTGYGGYITTKVFPHQLLVPTAFTSKTVISTKTSSSQRRLEPKVYRLRTPTGNVSCGGGFTFETSQVEIADGDDDLLIPTYSEENSSATIECRVFLNVFLLAVIMFML